MRVVWWIVVVGTPALAVLHAIDGMWANVGLDGFFFLVMLIGRRQLAP